MMTGCCGVEDVLAGPVWMTLRHWYPCCSKFPVLVYPSRVCAYVANQRTEDETR